MDILITAVLIAFLFALLASGLWIGLALLGVAWIGMELFTTPPRGRRHGRHDLGLDARRGPSPRCRSSCGWARSSSARSSVGGHVPGPRARGCSAFPGRLLHTNIIGCTIFAAVSGSSAATCATIGKMTLPELKRRGYPEDMTIGTLAGAGTLGLLIPPSIIMIVYGVTAEVSITKLFIAGVLPGLLLAGLFMGYTDRLVAR